MSNVSFKFGFIFDLFANLGYDKLVLQLALTLHSMLLEEAALLLCHGAPLGTRFDKVLKPVSLGSHQHKSDIRLL